MADPLSLAASIAGLISLADVAFKYTFKFVRATKDAKNDVSTLADEINNVGSVLRVLEALASDLEAEGDQFDPTLRNHYLNNCFRTLSRIETKAKKATERFARSKVESIYQQLKWPFSSSETKDLLAELSRHKETINIALAADSMRKLQLSLTKTEKLGQDISSIKKIVKRIEINTLINVDAQKQQVLDYFMRTNPQRNLETSIRLRHAMTGLWLTESPEFFRWLDTPGSKLWLTGIPGAGKTVLAGSVIQEALSRSSHDVGVAFFFCDYKDPETWSTSNILGSVANQFARQKKEAFDILNLYYDELHLPGHLAESPDPDELRARISQMSDLFDQSIIIIDGLDECGDFTDDIIDVLIQLTEDCENISLAVFSRDHHNIRIHLEIEFEIIPIAARTNDIQLYLGAELDRRIRTRKLQLTTPKMKEEIQEALVSRAEGMFRWVVCQLDYLCDCAHDEERRDALNKLPPDLPESYRRLLERVNKCSPRVQDMVQKCLHFLTLNKPKLTIHELRQAISTPSEIGQTLDNSNTVSEQEISRRCSSLIRKSTNGEYFEFAHFSVREFLESWSAVSNSPGLEKYWISRDFTSILFSAQCLRFLQMKNFDTVPIELVIASTSKILDFTFQMAEAYPFYKYAATWWLGTMKDDLDDSTILALAKSLFDSSKTTCFVLWAMELLCQVAHVSHITYGKDTIYQQACKVVARPSFRPLHMAAALNLPEICSFLLQEELDVNRKVGEANPIDLALVSVLAIPGMAGLSAEKSRENWRVRRVVDSFLPSSERRNKTIDYLIAKRAQPSSHRISPNSASVFSIVCILAATYNDLSPITKILSLDITPARSEIKVLQDWLEETDKHDDQAELSARSLMRQLGQPMSHSTDWGRDAAAIVWNWTLESKFSFQKDIGEDSALNIRSKRLDMIQINSAIRNDDVDTIKNWLKVGHSEKERLHLADEHKLLHLALQKSAFKVFKYLVDRGCDPYMENEQGNLPVHEALIQFGLDNLAVFRAFKDADISLFKPNADGNNILHLWVNTMPFNYGFIEHVFELEPYGTIKGLQMRNNLGDTPLTSLVVRQYNQVDLREVLFRIAGLLTTHDGSENTLTMMDTDQDIVHLMRNNIEFEAMVKVEPAPLHRLSYRNSLEQVQLLVKIYPEAVSCRYLGLLPIQRYIRGTLRGTNKSINYRITKALLPEDMGRALGDDKETVWNWFCGMVCESDDAPWSDISHIRFNVADNDRLEDMFSVFMEVGIMKAHEEEVRTCGLLSLGSALWHPRLFPTVRQVITQTEYWNEIRSSVLVSSIFRATIFYKDLEMMQFLLKHEADLHHGAKDSPPPIEVIFQGPEALKMCSSSSGVEMFKKILHHADRKKLVSFSSNEKSSLLHMLATSEDATTILWLAEELIDRGLDINQVGSGHGAESAINYHIRKYSFQFAELLLQKGADVLVNGVLPFHTLRAAIADSNIGFLKLIMTHAAEVSAEVNWTGSEPIIATNKTHTLFVKHENALHMASEQKDLACLEFLLKQDLLRIEILLQHREPTPLHVAAFTNSVEAVELLLASGFDVMAENKRFQTPLHLAALVGNLPVVKCLLSHGASDGFDEFGRTARTIAFENGFVEVANHLDEATKSNNISRSAHRKEQKPGRERSHAAALERAVRANDYESIELLIHTGCPIDLCLSTDQGGTALILALELEEPVVVAWLLEHHASVLSAKHTNGVEDSVIEIASARTIFNNQLERILQMYWWQGGDLSTDEDFPFHDAVWNGNTQGLEILINESKKHLEAQAAKTGAPDQHTLSSILNRQSLSIFYGMENWRSGTHYAVTTPLHIASWLGNKSAVSQMVKHGALVDAPDDSGWTALMYARSLDMEQHLISLGSSITAMCRFGSLSSMVHWFGSRIFCERYRLLSVILPTDLLNPQPAKQFPTSCEDILMTSESLGKLRELRLDLLAEDYTGRNLMHCIVCEEDLFHFVLNKHPDLESIGPFPWHLEWRSFSSLAFLTSSFDRYRRCVPFHSFRKFLNLEPSHGWSPLCRAAASNIVTIVSNCLDMGADIDYEGCSLGSAVMIASACGSLEAVQFLVRRGASVTYTVEGQFRSCYVLAGTEAVRQWLLVGRYKDTMMLTDEDKTASAKQESFWSGYRQVTLVLYGKRAKGPHESDRGYEKRKARLKRGLRGKVLNLHVDDSETEPTPVSDFPSEADSGSEADVG